MSSSSPRAELIAELRAMIPPKVSQEEWGRRIKRSGPYVNRFLNGHVGMKAETLEAWLREARRLKEYDRLNRLRLAIKGGTEELDDRVSQIERNQKAMDGQLRQVRSELRQLSEHLLGPESRRP